MIEMAIDQFILSLFSVALAGFATCMALTSGTQLREIKRLRAQSLQEQGIAYDVGYGHGRHGVERRNVFAEDYEKLAERGEGRR